jgi:hypothetical protein
MCMYCVVLFDRLINPVFIYWCCIVYIDENNVWT